LSFELHPRRAYDGSAGQVLVSSDLTSWLPTLDGTVSFTDLAFMSKNSAAQVRC